MKIIVVRFWCLKPECKFSMHYHMNKDETWYVEDGEFEYRWIDTEKALIHTEILKAVMWSDRDQVNHIN